MSVRIFGDTDDTSRNRTFIFIFRCKVGGRGTTVEHRNTKPLAATEYNVCIPFTRRCQYNQTHQISSYTHLCSGFMCTGNECAIVFDRSVGIRILYDGSEYIRCEFEGLIVSCHDADTLRNHAGMDDSQSRGKYIFIDEDRIGSSLDLCTATCIVEHGDCLSSCCGFI